MMQYDLESRWKLEKDYLQYYGLRNKKQLFKNKIRISLKKKQIIKKLPCELTPSELKILQPLIGTVIVPLENKKKVPKSLDEAVFCHTCIANDFIIPGLEFDTNGCCPMCQTRHETSRLKSVVPVMNEFPHCNKSRFDVAVFYTGGKDSTYLLYYLSKVLKLRVLALTWEIPYMSDSAKASIDKAKEHFDTVEFITRRVSNNDLKCFYRSLYKLSDNTCACPSLAYILFYPELVINKVPYFIVGNEPSQMLGLYYNHMAPKIAYHFGNNKLFNFIINIGRLLTLHPPLSKGQFHTLATMKQLAYGDNLLKNLAGYSNTLVSNVVKAIKEVPDFVKPLKRSIKTSSWTGNIPAFVQVDFNDICGGKYDWKNIKDLIIKECGWVSPEDTLKGLHTSCKIEKCKEYTQFKRFYDMKSTMIPFSALEISLASRDQNISREDAIAELKNSLGFSLEEIPECKIMKEYFL